MNDKAKRRSAQVGGHGEKLSRLQERAISALLAEPTVSKAAEAAGVADSTLRAWMKSRSFRRRYTEARRQVMDGAIGHLQTACARAAGVLVAVATDAETPPSTRVSAAKAILEVSFRGVDLLDLAERLEALETKVEKPR